MRYFAGLALLFMTVVPSMAEKTLTVGTTGDYEPVTWFDPATGDYVGEDIDLVRAFAAAEGYRVTFVRTTWAMLIDDLLAGKFEMAAGGISKTAARAKIDSAVRSDRDERQGRSRSLRRRSEVRLA